MEATEKSVSREEEGGFVTQCWYEHTARCSDVPIPECKNPRCRKPLYSGESRRTGFCVDCDPLSRCRHRGPNRAKRTEAST
jgi:hypothetical protein